MSYCRHSDNSDVYVYASADGRTKTAWVCCGCSIAPKVKVGDNSLIQGSTYTKTRREMVAHLKKHIFIGERVPQTALTRLMQEIETNEPL